METLDTLMQLDQRWFLAINRLHTPWLDGIMSIVTNKLAWIPLYLVLLYGIIRHYKLQSVGYILCILVVITLADQIASTFMKPYFLRLRPCHEPLLQTMVHLVGGCGGKYGFVSSHASTSFGIALIVNLLPTNQLTGTKWLFGWAVLYSLSRVYVGVHYPLDIIGGALVGIFSAYLLALLFRKLPRTPSTQYY